MWNTLWDGGELLINSKRHTILYANRSTDQEGFDRVSEIREVSWFHCQRFNATKSNVSSIFMLISKKLAEIWMKFSNQLVFIPQKFVRSVSVTPTGHPPQICVKRDISNITRDEKLIIMRRNVCLSFQPQHIRMKSLSPLSHLPSSSFSLLFSAFFCHMKKGNRRGKIPAVELNPSKGEKKSYNWPH